uniref:Uncharacterized protein n=1 Tax=Anguilla anguilla TaxID=7936 RepID=A0A0E9V026_ANGAN
MRKAHASRSRTIQGNERGV